MRYLDLTLSSNAENIACDEALLNLLENGAGSDELLRTWEARNYFVVLGYSNKAHREVRMEACQRREVPIYRRVSGGGTVLQGPGCLNYALFLLLPASGPLENITGTHRYVLAKHQRMLQELLGEEISFEGESDLTWRGRKFSGNAQRRKRKYVLYHGTFLLNFNFHYVESYLAMPSRQPDYRRRRPHRDFLTNLPTTPSTLKEALIACWDARDAFTDLPQEAIQQLAGAGAAKRGPLISG